MELEDDIKDKRIVYIDTPGFKEKYISKDKLKEKIEELNKDAMAISSFMFEDYMDNRIIDKNLVIIQNKINLLEEILESEE